MTARLDPTPASLPKRGEGFRRYGSVALLSAVLLASGYVAGEQFAKGTAPHKQSYRLAEGTEALCGPNCILTVCELFHKPANLSSVARITGFRSEGVVFDDCQKALSHFGLSATRLDRLRIEDCPDAKPVIISVRCDAYYHAVTVIRRGDELLVFEGPKAFRMLVTDFALYQTGPALVMNDPVLVQDQKGRLE